MAETITDPKPKSRVLYDAASAKYKLGTYEEFMEKLKDPGRARVFYDAAKKDFKLGEFEEFRQKIGIDIKARPFEPSFIKKNVGPLDAASSGNSEQSGKSSAPEEPKEEEEQGVPSMLSPKFWKESLKFFTESREEADNRERLEKYDEFVAKHPKQELPTQGPFQPDLGGVAMRAKSEENVLRGLASTDPSTYTEKKKKTKDQLLEDDQDLQVYENVKNNYPGLPMDKLWQLKHTIAGRETDYKFAQDKAMDEHVNDQLPGFWSRHHNTPKDFDNGQGKDVTNLSHSEESYKQAVKAFTYKNNLLKKVKERYQSDPSMAPALEAVYQTKANLDAMEQINKAGGFIDPETGKHVDLNNEMYDRLSLERAKASMQLDQLAATEGGKAAFDLIEQFGSVDKDRIALKETFGKHFDKDIARLKKQDWVDDRFGDSGRDAQSSIMQVLSPLGRSVTNFASAALKIPELVAGDDEYGAVNRWAQNVEDARQYVDEKVFMQPRSYDEPGLNFEGGDIKLLDENGNFNPDVTLPTGVSINKKSIIPQTARMLGDMATLLVPAGLASKAGRAAGLSQKVLGTDIGWATGLMGSSFTTSYQTMFQQALDSGLTREDAAYHARTGAAIQAVLELVSPNRALGGATGKIAGDKAIDVLQTAGKGGVGQRVKHVMQEGVGEVFQEGGQTLGDFGNQMKTNEILGHDYFDVSANKVAAEMGQVLPMAFLLSGGASGSQAILSNPMYNEAVHAASEDPRIMDRLRKEFKTKGTPEALVNKILSDIQSVTKYGPGEVGYVDTRKNIPLTKEQAQQMIIDGHLSDLKIYNDPELEQQLVDKFKDQSAKRKKQAAETMLAKNEDGTAKRNADGTIDVVLKSDPTVKVARFDPDKQMRLPLVEEKAPKIAIAASPEGTTVAAAAPAEAAAPQKSNISEQPWDIAYHDPEEGEVSVLKGKEGKAAATQIDTIIDKGITAGKTTDEIIAEIEDNFFQVGEIQDTPDVGGYIEGLRPAAAPKAAVATGTTKEGTPAVAAEAPKATAKAAEAQAKREAENTATVDELIGKNEVKVVTEEQADVMMAHKNRDVRKMGKVISGISKAIAKIAPGTRLVMLDNDAQVKEVAKKLGYLQETDEESTVHGFYDPDSKTAFFARDPNKAIHEAAIHPLMNVLKGQHPEVYKAFTGEIASVLQSMTKNGKPVTYLEKAQKNYADESPEVQIEEAIVSFFADVAEGKFNDPTILAKVKEIIRKVLSTLGVSEKDMEINLNDPATLRDIAEQVGQAIKNGRELSIIPNYRAAREAKAIAKEEAQTKKEVSSPHETSPSTEEPAKQAGKVDLQHGTERDSKGPEKPPRQPRKREKGKREKVKFSKEAVAAPRPPADSYTAPVTLAVLSDPNLKKMAGQMVNPQSIRDLIKSRGKQIEKDIINRVLDQEKYKAKRISFDEVRADIEIQTMKLERIHSDSYATYGRSNLGDNVDYGEAETIIFNAPVNHGETGHFSGDFKSQGLDKKPWTLRQLGDTDTWAAVDGDMPADVTQAELPQYVGTAGTKADVERWIENRSAVNQDINKGLFGHIRTWHDGGGPLFHLAELQSDYFQKNKASDLLAQSIPKEDIEGHLNETLWRPLNKETSEKLSNALGLTVKEEINEKISGSEEEPSKIIRVYDSDGDMIDGVIVDPDPANVKGQDIGEVERYQAVARAARKLVLNKYYGDDTKMEVRNKFSNQYTTFETREQYEEFFAKQERLADERDDAYKPIKDEYDSKRRSEEKVKADYIAQRVAEEQKTKGEDIILKQFIASQKIHEQRLFREAIKFAAESGAETLRFPAPYTIAVIEGYVDKSGEGRAPYEVIEGDNDRLGPGDVIDYGGTRMTVVDVGRGSNITVAKTDDVNSFYIPDYIREEVNYRIEELESDVERHFGKEKLITKEKVEDFDPDGWMGRDVKEVIEKYFDDNEEETSVTWDNIYDDIHEAITHNYDNMSTSDLLDGYGEVYISDNGDYAYVVESNGRRGSSTEEFLQPDQYEGNDTTEEGYEDDLSEEQQTVVKKYADLGRDMKKYRPDTEEVRDDNDMPWLETKITDADRTEPLIAFSKTKKEDASSMVAKAVEDKVVPGKPIPSMVITGKKNKEDVVKYSGPASLAAVREASPDKYISQASRYVDQFEAKGGGKVYLIPDSKIIRKPRNEEKQLEWADDVYKKAKATIVSNLIYIHDNIPQDVRDLSKLWYDGANIIATELSKKYNISLEQAAAIVATQSPQKPWFDNVHLGHFAIDYNTKNQDTVLTKEMVAYYHKRAKTPTKNNPKGYPKQLKYVPVLRTQIGKKYSELSDYDRTTMIRFAFDNLFERRAPKRLPTGSIINGERESGMASFSGYDTISKAVSVFNDGSEANIEDNLGKAFKVKNFFNNIASPNTEGEVTVDTHAIAAGHMRPFASTSPQVDFGNLNYALFAEAYREAGAQRDLSARQMQSITWEGARSLFPAEEKDGEESEIAKAAEAIWKDYKKGNITLRQAQRKIKANGQDLAKTPWSEYSDQLYAEGGSGHYLDELPGNERSGYTAEQGVRRGTEGGLPGVGEGNRAPNKVKPQFSKEETPEPTQTTKRVVIPTKTAYQETRNEYYKDPTDERWVKQRQSINDEEGKYAAMTNQEIVDNREASNIDDLRKIFENTNGNDNFGILATVADVRRAHKAGDHEKVTDLLGLLSKVGSGLGQLLRQMRELKSAVGNKSLIKDILKKEYKKAGIDVDEQLELKLDALIGDFTTAHEQEDVAKAAKLANPTDANIESFEKHVAATEKKYAELMGFVNDTMPNGLGNVIMTIIKGNLLTVGSVAVNTIGNVVNAINHSLIEGHAATFGGAVSRKIAGKESGVGAGTSAIATKLAMKAFIKAWRPALKEAFTRGAMRPADLTKFEVDRQLNPARAFAQAFLPGHILPKKMTTKNGRVIYRTPASVWAEKALEGTFGWPAAFFYRMLYLTDKPFKDAGKTFSSYLEFKGQKPEGNAAQFEEFIQNMDLATRKRVDKYSDKFTYNDKESFAAKTSNEFIGRFEKLADWVEKDKNMKVAAEMLRAIKTAVFPYVTVPANVVQHLLELSLPPVALYAAAKYHGRGQHALAGQMVGRAAVGTILYMTASTLAAAGLMMDSDDDRTEANDKSFKHQVARPNSINMSGLIRMLVGNGDTTWREGDKSVDLNKLGIFGMYLGAHANFAAAMGEKGMEDYSNHLMDAMLTAGGSVGKMSLQMPFMKGSFELLETLAGADKEGATGVSAFSAKTVETLSNLVWPNQVSQLYQAAESDVLKRASDKGFLGNVQERMAKRGFYFGALDTENLSPVLDIWGQPIPVSAKDILHPLKLEVATDNEAIQVWNLVERMDQPNPFTIPQGSIQLTPNEVEGLSHDVSVKLDELDFLDLQSYAGKFKKGMIRAHMADEEFQALSDQEKLATIQEINSVSNTAGRELFLAEFFKEVEDGNITFDLKTGKYTRKTKRPYNPLIDEQFITEEGEFK